MTGRRASPDGMPFRLYRRNGARLVTFYYQHRDNKREVLCTARSCNALEIRKAMAQAIRIAHTINEDWHLLDGSVAQLINEYFDWQEGLPADSELKKAASTLANNRQEAKQLKKFFGEMDVTAVRPKHCYAYQNIRIEMGAGPTANKELALLSTVMEYGRRQGLIDMNPCRGVRKVPTRPRTFLVREEDIWFALEVARGVAKNSHIAALAAAACWLTIRRPPEILSLTRAQINEAGITFTAAKRKAGEMERTTTITWSPVLREVIEEALQVKRELCLCTPFVFGTRYGSKYTKSGWGATWRRLMNRCEKVAKEQGKSFQRFTLADCRARGVTDKMERGDRDVQDATMHADSRMVQKVYDRRKNRAATPAR